MKAEPKIVYLLLILIVLLGCYIHYPNATPEPISPVALTAAPVNSEAEIANAKQVADRLIKACLSHNGEQAELHTPERLKRQKALMIPQPFCFMEDEATHFTLSDQYPYGQAVYFLYDYDYKNPDNSKNEKHNYCIEMMKSNDKTWLVNRSLDFHEEVKIDACFLAINKEK